MKIIKLAVTALTAAALAFTLAPAASADPGIGKIPKASASYNATYDRVINMPTRATQIALVLGAAGGGYEDFAVRAGNASTNGSACGKIAYVETLKLLNTAQGQKKWSDNYAKFYEKGFRTAGSMVGQPKLRGKVGKAMGEVVRASASGGNNLYAKGQARNIIGVMAASGCFS